MPQAASFSGHKAIIKLLIDHGADVDAKGGCYESVSEAASFGGYELIAKELIKSNLL